VDEPPDLADDRLEQLGRRRATRHQTSEATKRRLFLGKPPEAHWPDASR
jgi:hypothetical protein